MSNHANDMSRLLERSGRTQAPPLVSGSAAPTPGGFAGRPGMSVALDPANPKPFIRAELLKQLTPEDLSNKQNPTIRKKIRDMIENLMSQNKVDVQLNRKKVIEDIYNDVVGFGPIEPLLHDPTVTEIMVNRFDNIYIEVEGKGLVPISETDYREIAFENDTHLRQIILRIAQEQGSTVDEGDPLLDTRLPDGSRVNAVVLPCAIDGCNMTIRKFKKAMSPRKLLDYGTLTQDVYDFLQQAVFARANVVVSGGTGSGKTTTLNALSSFIPENERIVTVEDTAELQLQQDHVVRLETKKGVKSGDGGYRNAVTIRDLVVNTLRMRPDRIVVGECRAGEALDMLQAMNTGHDGSLTTAHANSPRDCCRRLETMALMAGLDMPLEAIREQVASAVDIIVQQARLRDHSRKITAITEVLGMGEDRNNRGKIILQDIFRFEEEGIDENGKIRGSLKIVHAPSEALLDKFAMAGAKLPEAFNQFFEQNSAS